MLDLNDLTADDFAPCIGQDFIITSLDRQVHLTLIEVKNLGAGQRKKGAFSLLWQGPPEPALVQATYTVSHATLGRCEMFCVPVALTDAGYQYEAVFT